MTIKWRGLSYFILKHNKKTVIIDPLSSKEYGIKSTNISEANICLLSSSFLKYDSKTLDKSLYSFQYPGEYEASNIIVKIISSIGPERKRNNIFSLDWDGYKIVHLGMVKQKASVEKILEDLNSPDILIVPIGGNVVLSADNAVELVHQIEPKIVIPMFYQVNKQYSFQLNNAQNFIKEMGQKENNEIHSKFKFKKTTTKKNEEKTELILLKP
jgi:L-ascorbate metabolism protein UlaG (beta-lactamase superfamily)